MIRLVDVKLSVMKIQNLVKAAFSASLIFASLACFITKIINAQSVNAQTTSPSIIYAPSFGGLCLNISNAGLKGPRSGAPVIAYTCSATDNEIFEFRADGTIRAPSFGGLCLNISNAGLKGPRSGAPVIAYTCSATDNEIFERRADGTIRAPYFGGLCLDISNAGLKGPRSGAPVIAYTCSATDNQRFF